MNRKEKRRQAKLSKKGGGVSPPTMAGPLITMLERAIGYQNAGQLDEAANIYSQVLLVEPNNTFANHLFGVIHLQRGDPETAVKLIETAVKYDPNNAEMLNNLSGALIRVGRVGDAEKSIRLALKHKPDYPEANSTMGKLLIAADKFVDAEQYILRAIELKPSLLSAHNNLGNALQGLGRVKDAEQSFRRALELNADDPDALNNLGILLVKGGRLDDAEQSFRHAIELFPEGAAALNNLGHLLMIDDSSSEAEENYRRAIAIDPGNAEFHTNLGTALHYLERIEEAEACFRHALELHPGYVKALSALAHAQVSAGFLQEAIHTYNDAIKLEPQNTGLKVKRALALPIIPASLNDIAHARAQLLENVEQLISNGGHLIEPGGEAGITGFYLAYHNQNDVPYVKKIAEMYLKLCPSLSWQAEHCYRDRENGKYRIGFLSYHLYDHTIGKLCRGIIEHLDPNLFEITVFRTSRLSDPMADAIESAAKKVVYLQHNLDNARQAVADEKLDILYYPDVGMDVFTYFLAFARLAPVQVTSWGHPMSTGIPNIDYFISSQDLETEKGADHYTETLVRLAHPPTYYYRPAVPPTTDARLVHDLPIDKHIYLCPQTLFKIHPKFDSILGEVLRGDPDGLLVFIAGRYKSKDRLLRERFAKVFPDVIDRVVFLPRMKMSEFLQLIRVADVVLDPVYFSGGNSSAETIAMGVPIVTWPDVFLRDRVTYAFYKMMGIRELIATSENEYVNIANRLAIDRDFHERMSQLINERSEHFFENNETVRELEQFMIAAIEAQRNGNAPVHWGEPD